MSQKKEEIFELGKTKIDLTRFKPCDALYPLEWDVKIETIEDYEDTFKNIMRMVLRYEFLDLYTGDEIAKILKLLEWAKELIRGNSDLISETREVNLQKD